MVNVDFMKTLFSIFISMTCLCHAVQAQDLSRYFTPLDEVIIPYMEQQQIPGVALALYAEGKGTIISYGIVDKETNKPITANTLFEIASLTKLFTATDLALKIIQGKMNLGDAVAKHLPSIAIEGGDIKEVTLLQLATHTSGLPRTPPKKNTNSKLPMIIHFLKNWEADPDYSIGTHYLYSNLGYGLLGFALESVDHKTFEEILKQDILNPLGMTSTTTNLTNELLPYYAQGYSRDGQPTPKLNKNILPSSVALKSTASDMLKFLEANLSKNEFSDLIKAMKLTQQEYFKVSPKLTMGLGWQRIMIDGFSVIDKNGGVPGFSSYIGIIPEKNLGIVILANKAKIQSTQFGRLILKKLASINN